MSHVKLSQRQPSWNSVIWKKEGIKKQGCDQVDEEGMCLAIEVSQLMRKWWNLYIIILKSTNKIMNLGKDH